MAPDSCLQCDLCNPLCTPNWIQSLKLCFDHIPIMSYSIMSYGSLLPFRKGWNFSSLFLIQPNRSALHPLSLTWCPRMPHSTLQTLAWPTYLRAPCPAWSLGLLAPAGELCSDWAHPEFPGWQKASFLLPTQAPPALHPQPPPTC